MLLHSYVDRGTTRDSAQIHGQRHDTYASAQIRGPNIQYETYRHIDTYSDSTLNGTSKTLAPVVPWQ